MERRIKRLMVQRKIRKNIKRYVPSGFMVSGMSIQTKKRLNLEGLDYTEQCRVISRTLIGMGIENKFIKDENNKFGGYRVFNLNQVNKIINI